MDCCVCASGGEQLNVITDDAEGADGESTSNWPSPKEAPIAQPLDPEPKKDLPAEAPLPVESPPPAQTTKEVTLKPEQVTLEPAPPNTANGGVKPEVIGAAAAVPVDEPKKEPAVEDAAAPASSPQPGASAPEFTPQSMATYTVIVLILVVGIIYGAARGSGAVCLLFGVMLVQILVGDLFYSRVLSNYVFKLTNTEVTPANDGTHEKDPDFVATPAYILFGHHWTSITGAAPIIGPAVASYYGWFPAMAWVLFGGLFAGSVHDFGVLVVSARHGGKSIGDLAGILIHPRARVIFLMLLAFLVWIVVAVFMNAIANLFMANPETVLPVNAEIPLAAAMGLAARVAGSKLSPQKAKAVVMGLSVLFLGLLYVLVWAGVKIEEDGALPGEPVMGWSLHVATSACSDGTGSCEEYEIERQICRDAAGYSRDADGNPTEATCAFGAKQFWTLYLTAYALVVSVIPVWVVLQPRDFINSHQLKAIMFMLILGLIIKAPVIDADAIRAEVSDVATEKAPLLPMLFTTIACGSVSGFHGLVSSGVTSKQLNQMRDARVIGYNGMMGESALSALVIVVCCASGYWASYYQDYGASWTGAFIPGATTLLEELGFETGFARACVIVLVVSFAATTLDSGMRIQRILIGELGRAIAPVSAPVGKALQNVFVGGLLSAIPACLLANTRLVGSLWNLFGATNQLVACLSLCTVVVYVLRLHDFDFKYALPFAVPALWLGIFIFWAMVKTIDGYLYALDGIDWFTTVPTYPSIIIAFIITLFFIWLLLEVIIYFATGKFRSDKKIDKLTGKIDYEPLATNAPHMPAVGCC